MTSYADKLRAISTPTELDDEVIEDTQPIPEGFEPTKTEGKGLVETLSVDNNFEVIEQYMSQRFGMDTSEYDKEELIDSYVNQMRGFNSGQSLITLSELTFLNTGDDAKLANKRKAAQDAYKLFDSLGGAFSKDRTTGEKADAVYDYARALVVDPINIVSLGAGKLFSIGASKTAVQGAKNLAFRVGRQAATKELKRTGSKKAAAKVQTEVTQRAYQEALKKSKTKAILDKADRKSIYGSLGFDMVSAGALDVAQQKAEVISGFKEEIDFFQAGISTATGALGGATQLGLVYLKNKKAIPLASIQLHRAGQVKKFEGLQKLSSEQLAQELFELKERTTTWARMVKEGKKLTKVSDNPKTSVDYDTEFALKFFIGSEEEGWDGVASVLSKAGYKKPEDMQVSLYIKEALEDMPSQNKKLVEEAYEILRDSSDQLKDFSFEDFLNIGAKTASEAGQRLNVESQIAKRLQAMGLDPKKTPAEKAAKATLDPLEKGIKKTFGERLVNVQENLVRAIVTHPGTTGLNAIGWKAATINQSASDMIRAALYGGGSVFNTLKGDSVNALKYKNLATQMMSLQRQKVRNMVDAYGTYESVMDYLAIRPGAQQELFRYINGGVELKGILDEFKLNPKEIPNKSNYQKFSDFFETAYGVKAQDFLTKTQEFQYSLDREIRLKYNKTYHEFMDDPNLVGLLSEPGSEAFKEFAELEARAVQNALRNTFSKKFGNQDDLVGQTANIIENVRSVPVLGALAPFGQFWNNSVAFMLDHSGLSLLNKYTIKAGGKDIVTRDTMDLSTKTAVGWGTVAIATASQIDNLEEGLAWYEDRDEFGAVKSYLYDYPRNVPMLVGRMGAHAIRDGSVPKDLFIAFGDNFGTRALTDDMGEAFGIVGKAIYLAGEAEDTEFLEVAGMFLGDLTSQHVSGFTRRFDPINQAVAMARGEDYKVVDKKEGNKVVNDSLRYMDQIFEVLADTSVDPDKVKSRVGIATTEKEQALTREPGQVPIGRLSGYREVLPSTTIQKLYNDVGKPQWQTEIRSKSPEAVNVFNKYVRPRLEIYADSVADSGQWDSLSLREKRNTLTDILSIAKKDSLEALDRSIDPEEKKTKLIFTVKNKGKKADLRRALDYFKIDEKDMWTLDVNQLLLLEDLVENFANNEEKLKKDLGLE